MDLGAQSKSRERQSVLYIGIYMRARGGMHAELQLYIRVSYEQYVAGTFATYLSRCPLVIAACVCVCVAFAAGLPRAQVLFITTGALV